MNEVLLGDGDLAGRGVYAARDFAAGEVVIDYRLRPLTTAEYHALPPGEDLFVHSYGGRRFLYPPPARFVNHSDDPSCWQDFDRGCDIALRPIARGEPITIDATQETARELSTFLDAYRTADSAVRLGELVDADAVLWLSGQAVRGREAVVAALLTENRDLTRVEWTVGTGRWEALCSAGTTRHLTMLLKVVAGNWQLTYQHLG
ncbi:hypothetical protein BJY16_006958 [Actinoplanes octamycinicus]|uniref:SET domain-containing protein n=1 Tax=Actinoplanes octamycinicus TaxID=135948 RepID=A0A7W7H3V8_9ACTN|nr:SET domain-containing protein [Actinoplanes octamycinicus]MBB4743499.1 hypothetical protein [Actinoplanes octamycinicus]GIE62515.1 hypothetical protein Aoc01nite_79170 [Actinoplanes octamycinicus]